MGYEEREGVWQHPDRVAIFVGDFIDRGPKQLETVGIVRRMVEAGKAKAVMGNHEFNAIAYYFPDPENPQEHLRPHSTKNNKQHKAFLDEVSGDIKKHEEVVSWFLTLPLWLDLPELRIVHACWHQKFMDYLAPKLDVGNKLNLKLMGEASRKPIDPADLDSAAPSVFKAVDAILKGIEIPLPPPHKFTDKDGHVRDRVRTAWWDSKAATYKGAALLTEKERKAIPDLAIPNHARIDWESGKPVFFGHYWMTGKPGILAQNATCVDYSIAKGGDLVSYRWRGERPLQSEGFVSARGASAEA